MDDRPRSPRSDRHRRKNRTHIRLSGIAPAAVFDIVSDIDGLPQWNTAITSVVERPPTLEPGATWKVRMRDGALSWISRSTVVEHDAVARTFVYRSGTDDENPSYAEWRWWVYADGDDTVVSVSWELCPRTALRRWLLAPYRSRRLRREVPASLVELGRHVAASRSDAGNGPRGSSPDRPATLLGVWAHPDDEAYLSAALMHRVASAGGRVVVATATLGEAGLSSMTADRAAAVRRSELEAALAAVDVHELRLFGYADGECAAVDHAEGVVRVEALLRELRPDLVVTFGPDGITGHPDHLAVSRWTIEACRTVGHSELLLATMTDDFRLEHEPLHERLGLSMGPELQSVPEHEVALRVTPTLSERARKRHALDAHRSQTGPLAELLGYSTFHDWWVDECFRAVTDADVEWAATAVMTGRTS